MRLAQGVNAVHVHSLADLGLLGTLRSPGARACAALAFSADGRRLAAAELGPGRQVTVFDWREVRVAVAMVMHTLLRKGFMRAWYQLRNHIWHLKVVLQACKGKWMQTCEGMAASGCGCLMQHVYLPARVIQREDGGPLLHERLMLLVQGTVEAQAQGPWPATQLSFCPGDGNRLAALGASALALWRMHTLAGPPELYLSAVADPSACLRWQIQVPPTGPALVARAI